MSSLRVDAERNRERIVTAAQMLFAERGIDVTMEEVAKRAGVGAATLYRRFPTRADLVAIRRYEHRIDIGEEAAQRLVEIKSNRADMQRTVDGRQPIWALRHG